MIVLCKRCESAHNWQSDCPKCGPHWGVWLVDDDEFKDGMWCRDETGDEYFRGNKEEAEARAAWFRAEHGAKKDRPRYSVERMPVGTAVKAASPITADAARVSLAFESVVEALREALSLATALHARDHRADIAECAQDRRQAETLSQAERRVHAVMWERESPAVRERYAAEAVGLLAWIKGAK